MPPPWIAPIQEDTNFVLLHFNDVYEIEARKQEPVGGAARFVHLINSMKDEDPVVLFSGDAFNPSMLSTVTKGKHMIPILNSCSIKASVYGNHDFDFGIDALVEMAGQCNFPWLISNALDKETKKPLANGMRTWIVEHQGKKLGLMGLIEHEWLTTLAMVEEEDVIYTDFIEEGRKIANELREQGVDMVIALTHMRLPNDEKLAAAVPEIDLVLGGHDHSYAVKKFGPTLLVKSGVDFRDISKLRVTFVEGGRPLVTTEHLEIDSELDEDSAVADIVESFSKELKAKMEEEIGSTAIDLDCRFSAIRTQETNCGNFVADVIRDGCGAEITILNSGTLRADAIIPAGPLLMKDLVRLLPMMDEVTVLGLTGEQLILALENGVSQWPKMEGRFPQVSGVSFEFDGTKKAGERVVVASVKVQGEPVQLTGREYQVATKAYLALGKDGYDVFRHGRLLKSAEQCPVIPSMLSLHFRMLDIAKKFQSVTCGQTTMQHAIDHFKKRNMHTEQFKLNPKVEGRIVQIGSA